VNINKYARKWIFKYPEKSISPYLMTPEEQWKKIHKPLDTWEANRIVCNTPIQITKQMVEKHLAPSKWMSVDIVNWWLAYWCERLPENTFFTGEKSKSKSKRLTSQGSFVKEKILCVSSHFYQHIDRDFKHPENPSKNELDNLQIFKSFGILVPIHEENHWFLVLIRFNIARTKVDLQWYDSFVSITKASELATKYDKQIQVISNYLQRRYLQFLGDAQTSESQLKITNVIGRLNKDQHGDSVECGVWTCMYASYVTLQLPVDLRASKGSDDKTHMIPVRTWMLKSMLNCLLSNKGIRYLVDS
jgi:Ulp1 family protease